MPLIRRTIRLLLGLGVAATVFAGTSTIALVVTGQPAQAATGSDIANIAHAELGNGCAKYGSTPGTCNPDDPEWCADFARWVWRQAGVDYTTELNSFAVSFYSYGTRHNAIDADPQVGDAVVYADNTTWNSGQANHVNLVYAVNGSQIETIGGNEGNRVSFTNWFDWHNAATVIGAGPVRAFVHPVGVPGPNPGAVEQSEFADVDGDGRGDLVGISGANNDLTAYRNQGWGTPALVVGWDRASLVSGFGDASRTTFADIDGDGRADLIGVSGPNNDLTAYRNQGWNAGGGIVGWDRKPIASGFGPLWPLKFTDADGDRRADLIGISGPNQDMTAYRNQGWTAPNLIVGWDRQHVVSGFPA